VRAAHPPRPFSRFPTAEPRFGHFFASQRAWTPLCAAAAAPAVHSLGRWAGAAHRHVFWRLRQRQRPCGDVPRCARCGVCVPTSAAPVTRSGLRVVFESGVTPPPSLTHWAVTGGNFLEPLRVRGRRFASNSCPFRRLSRARAATSDRTPWLCWPVCGARRPREARAMPGQCSGWPAPPPPPPPRLLGRRRGRRKAEEGRRHAALARFGMYLGQNLFPK